MGIIGRECEKKERRKGEEEVFRLEGNQGKIGGYLCGDSGGKCGSE